MRNPWIIAQLVVAAVLLALTLIGLIGTAALGLPRIPSTFASGIQEAFVFPGLVLSLIVNAFVMRAHRSVGLSTAEKVLLIVEGVLIALLLVFHFSPDESGDFFGWSIVTWPVVTLVAVAIACLAIFRAVSSRQGGGPSAASPPDAAAPVAGGAE